MIVYLCDSQTRTKYWEADIYNNDIHCNLYAKNYFDKLIEFFKAYNPLYYKWYDKIDYLDEYRGEIFEHRLAGKPITTEQIIEVTLEDMRRVAEELGLKVGTD